MKGSEKLIFFFVCISFVDVQSYNSYLDQIFPTKFQWKQIEIDYENEVTVNRQQDIQSGFYDPTIPAPIDVDVFDNGRQQKVFVTIPRFQPGIPATLGYISNRNRTNGPVLTPFPSWYWHREPNSCRKDRLISVYRVHIDECDRLWVLDTGRYGASQTCPPQIIAFNPDTEDVIHRFEIPSNLLESRSILVTPLVDNRDAQCKNSFVYIADCQTYSIIVLDVVQKRFWKATDKTLYPDPEYGTFRIQGDQFDLMDGVLGMALEPFAGGSKDRKLFYTSLSAGTQNWVYTSHLRNRTRFEGMPESSPEVFNFLRYKRPSQSAAIAIDKRGTLFFGLMTETSLDCWHIASPSYFDYTVNIGRDVTRFQFASGIKMITNRRTGAQELWILTCRFQKVAVGNLNFNEVNFRILAGNTLDLTQNKKCAFPPSYYGGGGYRTHSNFYEEDDSSQDSPIFE